MQIVGRTPSSATDPRVALLLHASGSRGRVLLQRRLKAAEELVQGDSGKPRPTSSQGAHREGGGDQRIVFFDQILGI